MAIKSFRFSILSLPSNPLIRQLLTMPFKEVTPTQASALTNLKTALQPSVKDFACKGVVPLSRLDIQDLQLYFQDPNGSLR